MEATASVLVLTYISLAANLALSIRFPERIANKPIEGSDQPLKTAAFALGSFWRSEAAFGCSNGVVRTAAGYAGGSRPNPEYRSLGDHAECVQVCILSSFAFIKLYFLSDLLLRVILKVNYFLC